MGSIEILGARLISEAWGDCVDVRIDNNLISSIEKQKPISRQEDYTNCVKANGGLCLPSLCHAHVHLDKCFILSDPKFADLEILEGDFAEAMELTGKAKQRFDDDDLLRRGRRLIEESINHGVTAMRAFVEVDEIVELKCVEAAITLKRLYRDECVIQICAFAQLALFSGNDGGEKRRQLFEEAIGSEDVDVVGSTPYVEDDELKMKMNVTWCIDQALKRRKHLDFHLDYNLEATQKPMIWFVLEELRAQDWMQRASTQVITFGHCTRLTLFSHDEWSKLKGAIGNLPIHFVGLPTSDLFMMGRPSETSEPAQRPRGTLQIVDMINRGFNCAMSINNIGNAFTPQGSCNPLYLASLGVAVYQASTKQATEKLYEAVSTRAMAAIGLASTNLLPKVADQADLIILEDSPDGRGPKDLYSAVTLFDTCRIQAVIHRGKRVR